MEGNTMMNDQEIEKLVIIAFEEQDRGNTSGNPERQTRIVSKHIKKSTRSNQTFAGENRILYKKRGKHGDAKACADNTVLDCKRNKHVGMVMRAAQLEIF